MNNTQTKSAVIDKTNEIDLNSPKCSIFGSAKENNPACTECEKKFNARNKACLELTTKTAKNKKLKKVAGSNLDCFGCNINEDTHLFVKEIYKNTHTMKAIKACSWNKNSSTFYCKANTLIEKGLLLKNKKSKSYSLSSKGNKIFKSWIEKRKSESKKEATG